MTVTDSTPPATERDVVDAPEHADAEVAEELVEDELLVEEISIDGMCGVY